MGDALAGAKTWLTRFLALFNPALEIGSRRSSGPAIDLDAIAKQHQRRNAANCKALRERRLGIRVDLGELHAARKLLRGKRVLRRHRTTRTAPCCPEVDND